MGGWLNKALQASAVVFLTCAVGALWAATPAEYKRAKNLFEYGDYKTAVPLLEELVLPGRLEDELEVAAAHRMLGVAYHQTGRKQEAAREFKSLLYLEPDAALDPFLTPPDVVEFFDTVKQDMADRLPQLRELRAKERADREKLLKEPGGRPVETVAPRTTQVVRRVRVVPWPLLFAPLGIPQFMMGHWLRGAAVLAITVLSPVPSMVFFLLARAMVGNCLPLAVDNASGAPTPGWDLQGCNPFAGPTADPKKGGGAGINAPGQTQMRLHIFFTVCQYISLLAIPTAYAVGVLDALIFPTLEIPEGDIPIEAPLPAGMRPTRGTTRSPAAAPAPAPLPPGVFPPALVTPPPAQEQPAQEQPGQPAP